MSDQIALREIFDGDDVVGHWLLKHGDSDHIRKALFHFPELADAEPQKNYRNDGARGQTRPGKGCFARQACTSETRR